MIYLHRPYRLPAMNPNARAPADRMKAHGKHSGTVRKQALRVPSRTRFPIPIAESKEPGTKTKPDPHGCAPA